MTAPDAVVNLARLNVKSEVGTLPVFLGIWTAMMIAMMAPSAYPTVRLFAVARGSRAAFGVRPAPVWAFVFGYVLVWAAFGLPAYFVLQTLGDMGMAGWFVAFALVTAGVYQLTPWKSRCLGHCRSPAMFFLHAWRDGPGGAVLMGMHHGAYCVGCCWGLMLVLLALGAMQVGWMVAVAAVIFVEKVLPLGPLVGRVLGGVMIAAGVALAAGWIRG